MSRPASSGDQQSRSSKPKFKLLVVPEKAERMRDALDMRVHKTIVNP